MMVLTDGGYEEVMASDEVALRNAHTSAAQRKPTKSIQLNLQTLTYKIFTYLYLHIFKKTI